jgi:putative spermidine/putrescine transport system ATP-binding protein
VEIYDRPRTLFVNSFVGTANLLAGEIIARDGGTLTVALDAGATVTLPVAAAIDGKRVIVSARPENLRLHSQPGTARWSVQVRIRMPVGAQTVSEVVTAAGESLKVTEPRASAAPSDDAGVTLYCAIGSTSAVSLFPAPAAAPAQP